MYTKKYIINNGLSRLAKSEFRNICTEVSFDGEAFKLVQYDADTGRVDDTMKLTEDDARDLRDIIQEILEQGE